MKKQIKLTVAVATATVSFALSANAATVVPFSSITGFSGGDSFTPQNFTQINNGIGIVKPDANDPSTWSTPNNNNYQEEWYDNFLVGAANNKLGWISFDLGSSQTQLDNLYLIQAHAQTQIVSTATFNIYHADTPTVALPSPPGGNSSVDYDFASGGWTQLGATRNLTRVDLNAQAFDLSSISSARYIALEIMSAHTTNGRVGFDEAAITVVPEPSAALLGGLGALLLLRRRRG